MNTEMADKVQALYPQLLTQPSGRSVELRIANGWCTLLDDLLWLLDQKRRAGHVHDLRFTRNVLDAFELLSTGRCERCGLPGRRRIVCGGVFTLCDEHARDSPFAGEEEEHP